QSSEAMRISVAGTPGPLPDQLVLLGDQHEPIAVALTRVGQRDLSDLGRPRAIERGAVVEPELGDPVPRLAAFLRRRAGDQAHAILSQVGQRLAVRHVLVEPPAVEPLAAPALWPTQQHHDLDHWASAPPSMTSSLPVM